MSAGDNRGGFGWSLTCTGYFIYTEMLLDTFYRIYMKFYILIIHLELYTYTPGIYTYTLTLF